ncbi:histidine phosphatase family protein [Paenibacillus sp. 481]|uniref:histidine phosphatase family protein n=1 Tax=Paenibacillus sp. 481 TaxID=2835869 RepID=UPI001E51F44B|nr:histidine phosphatase family protein [Paenibacillus sp. 481]UHA72977.1 histidine phosphatase family protein [Paenibacillus sp. 481]
MQFTLGLVRHGQTDWNVLGKIQGRTDIPLNESGREQAHRLAERLFHDAHKFDVVVTSGLQRADETGLIIANRLGIPVEKPERHLEERFFGLVEGTTPEEREQRWGTDWRTRDLGQEKNDELLQRAVACIEMLYQKYEGKSVLAITHGSWLAQLFVSLHGESSNEHIGNMSFSVLERHPEGWRTQLFNCTQHMESRSSMELTS